MLEQRSISFASHLRASMAFLASVMTGVSRWGILLYRVNSTRFGSIIMNFNVSGGFLKSRELIKTCIVTDFPDPVAPAISRWGILARLVKCDWPDIPLPKDTISGF